MSKDLIAGSGPVDELEPVETTSMEIAKVMAEGDADAMLALLERKAELAPRWNKAINTILVTQTYPEDWTEQGGKMCLGSAGAERVARLFSIRFHDQTSRKEDFSDATGRGYRYIYECSASMGDRTVFAQGSYSTRDKFLGYKDGKWRPVEDVNEGNIRNAAYHICLGNAVKALLGLRGIPAERFREIMDSAGEDASRAKSVSRTGKGAKGKSRSTKPTGDEKPLQMELANICIELARRECLVEMDADGAWQPVPMAESDDRPELERARQICMSLSSFKGKDGSQVAGLPASQLKGKRLEVTLAIARKVVEALG